MTQRVARPMKFAAFISIIISVAVMFAACQGAVGPKGDKGTDGTDGATGATGTSGSDGFTPLSLKGTAPFVIISDGASQAPGTADPIDLSDYYRGGEEPLELSDPKPSSDEDNFTAKLVGTMLTVTPADKSDYAINTFTVTITDADGSTVELEIRARRNRAPTVPTASDKNVVGTQAPAEALDMTGNCPAANECVVELNFADKDTLAGEDKLTFEAISADTSKVEVVKVETDTTGVIARVFLKGIASTWADADTTDDKEGHKPVKISVTATDVDNQVAVDTDGDASEGVINISVDGAPTADSLPDGTVSEKVPYMFKVDGFFKDPEKEKLSYTAEVSPATAKYASVKVAGSTVTVTRAAPGSAVITVTATEDEGNKSTPRQSVKETFTVTVN